MREIKFRAWDSNDKEYREMNEYTEKMQSLLEDIGSRHNPFAHPSYVQNNEYKELYETAMSHKKEDMEALTDGKMVYSGFVIYPEDGLCTFPESGWDINGPQEDPEKFVLMQYTGIKDKNET